MRLNGWRNNTKAEQEELLRKREHESNELHEIGEEPAEPVKKGCFGWMIGKLQDPSLRKNKTILRDRVYISFYLLYYH